MRTECSGMFQNGYLPFLLMEAWKDCSPIFTVVPGRACEGKNHESVPPPITWISWSFNSQSYPYQASSLIFKLAFMVCHTKDKAGEGHRPAEAQNVWTGQLPCISCQGYPLTMEKQCTLGAFHAFYLLYRIFPAFIKDIISISLIFPFQKSWFYTDLYCHLI